MIDFFKVKWAFVGLDAPAFAWIAAAILLIGSILLLGWLWWRVHVEKDIYQETVKRLHEIHSSYPLMPGSGLPGIAIETLAQCFESKSALKPAWQFYAAQLIRQRNANGEDEYWSSESAGSAFSEETVIERNLNKNFYIAIPGLITGIGLLVTFLAILVALLDVKLVGNRFEGLDFLIQGLSGKFLSSIAGLLSAAIFLPFEKRFLHTLTNKRLELVGTIDTFVPRLSPSQILVNIHRDISEQSEAFRHFNTDLSTKLKQSFNESMGPTLERMVSGVEALNQLLRAAEAQKQDSIVGSIETLLKNLEISIVRTLEQVTKSFSESISGSTMAQFDRVADSLGGTANLLEGMNTQFQGSQAALSELVSFAKNSTTEQMELGRAQVEELTSVLRGLLVQIQDTATEQRELGKTQAEDLTKVLRDLMVKVQDTAGSSVTQMAASLTSVVSALSNQVTELGQQMSANILDSAELASNTANSVIENANNWSSQSAEQLAQLLEKHQAHLDRIEDVRGTLDSSLLAFKGTLTQFTSVTTNLKEISTQVNALVTSASRTTEAMQNTQTSMQRVTGITAGQIEKLGVANENQAAVWRQIDSAMQRYQQVFSQVEEEAGALLTQIQHHINNYTETTKSGFDGLVSQANNHFTNATQRLGTSVEELAEYLDDLGEVLDKNRKK